MSTVSNACTAQSSSPGCTSCRLYRHRKEKTSSDSAISETANKKIRDGDVILTYSHSKLVEKVLLDAAAEGKKIQVIVADGRVQNLGNT